MALILVVDDDAEMCEMISIALEKEGHEVASCPGPVKADEFIAGRKPDLLLLDLVFEKHDGLDYLQKLAEGESTKGIPVIVVSALRQKKKIVEGLKKGAIDYITKPFDVVELKVRVTSALKVHELRSQQSANEELDAMRETARTVQNEIDLPMREIQRGLIQLRSELEDFSEDDRKRVEEAWQHLTRLEDILEQAMRGGGPGGRR